MITIPECFWSRMLDEFSKDKRRVEQVCYFDGVMLDTSGVVTTLTFPRADNHAGRFNVSAEAMSEAGKHLRQHCLRRLAQVHTHPAEYGRGIPPGTTSWRTRKCRAQFHRTTAVWPVRPSLQDAGCHLRMDGGWRQLRPDELAEYLRVIPSFLISGPRRGGNMSDQV